MRVSVVESVWMKRSPALSIAMPASFVSDTPHLREKTVRIGIIARAAAIFRVEEIIVFPDQLGKDQRRDARLIEKILSYMETPQYLRKRLFRIEPELRYAGVLPPLRTPHHPLSDRVKDLRVGEFREGVVVSRRRGGALVDVGVEEKVFVPNLQLAPNRRVTVKITEIGRRVEAVLASRDQITEYWGYRVTVSRNTLGRLLRTSRWDLTVATSRHGTPFMKIKDELVARWKNAHKRLVAFGAPTQGLYEIIAQEGLSLDEEFDFVVNTIPKQGTKTVRTEEAVYASLAIMNLYAGA